MPRRNFYLLLVVSVVSLLCVRQSPGPYRHYAHAFSDVMKAVDERYLEPLDRRTVFEAAMEGVVARLDPNCAYFPPEESQQLRAELKNEFGGIGVEVNWDEEKHVLMILSPMVGSPAYEGGIRPGDEIVAVDGTPIAEMAFEDAVRSLRGAPGTAVRLLVRHSGDNEPIELELRRAVINPETVLGDSRFPNGTWNFFLEGEQTIGYIRVSSFGDRTVGELKHALDWLQERNVTGLVLDLRNNPGGLLTAATETCDLFLDEGRIVSTRGRDGEEIETWDAQRGGYLQFPIAILVNQYSASASEIVAACLQDHDRAIVVGQRSYGKGTVQDLIELEGGESQFKLTTASYWRPSGRNIHRLQSAGPNDEWGVQPNAGYECTLSDEEFVELLRTRRKRDVVRPPEAADPATELAAEAAEDFVDRQLTLAVEYLKSHTPTAP